MESSRYLASFEDGSKLIVVVPSTAKLLSIYKIDEEETKTTKVKDSSFTRRECTWDGVTPQWRCGCKCKTCVEVNGRATAMASAMGGGGLP